VKEKGQRVLKGESAALKVLSRTIKGLTAVGGRKFKELWKRRATRKYYYKFREKKNGIEHWTGKKIFRLINTPRVFRKEDCVLPKIRVGATENGK